MRLRFTTRALAEIEHVRRYLAETAGEKVAAEQIRRIDQATQRLLLFPESCPPGRVAGTRELVVLNTPFIVPYSVTGDEIAILAVMHHARKWPDEL